MDSMELKRLPARALTPLPRRWDQKLRSSTKPMDKQPKRGNQKDTYNLQMNVEESVKATRDRTT